MALSKYKNAAEMEANIDNATPYIGENGHWFRWNADAKEYQDTGKPARGEKGDKGLKGDSGETPNITVGAITTGEPGTSATVKITGTTPNLVMDMQIPRGADGTGVGDMTQAVYDPHHRKQDIFSTFSNPNQLVNGDFQIWQRGTAFQNIISTIYTADRWVCASASGSGLAIRKADNGLKMVKSFAGTRVLMTQRFEHLPKQFPLTVSASIDNVVVSFTMNTASPVKTEPFAGGYIEAGIGSAGGSGFSVTVVLTEQKEITVNWVKAEYGTVATPFVPRFYGEELSMCQRYYEALQSFRIYKGARNPWSMASELSLYPFKATKRTLPTVKFKYMRSDSGGTAVSGTASHSGFDGFVDYNCVFDCDYVDFTEVFADAEIY